MQIPLVGSFEAQQISFLQKTGRISARRLSRITGIPSDHWRSLRSSHIISMGDNGTHKRPETDPRYRDSKHSSNVRSDFEPRPGFSVDLREGSPESLLLPLSPEVVNAENAIDQWFKGISMDSPPDGVYKTAYVDNDHPKKAKGKLAQLTGKLPGEVYFEQQMEALRRHQEEGNALFDQLVHKIDVLDEHRRSGSRSNSQGPCVI